MSNVFENKGALAATIVVAASNSLNKGQANYVCDGVNDHVEIQAALDALPATGGEVKLLEGTYNCQATINLDSNQTLRGCGKNTILTTSTANLRFLSAVGGSGTEKTGIVIADLQIDGGAGYLGECGIYFDYVDYSLVQNVYSRRHNWGAGIYRTGITLVNSDFNAIVDNLCTDTRFGIYLYTNSSHNIVNSNVCLDNANEGIYLYDGADHNTVAANVCEGNNYGIGIESLNNIITDNICLGNHLHGIYLVESYNVVNGNICQGNGSCGIYCYGDHNIIANNYCTENSQTTTNTSDDIYVYNSDYNNIQGNTCRAGALIKKPRYGINISNAACDGNLVTNNDLYNDGFGTGSFNNAGTGTVTAAGNRV